MKLIDLGGVRRVDDPHAAIPPPPRRPCLAGVLPSPLLPNHLRLANRVAGVAEGDPEAVASMISEGEEMCVVTSFADLPLEPLGDHYGFDRGTPL